MKVATEKIEGSQVVLSVELDQEEVDRSLDQAYKRLVQRTNVPGFRRGKAPRAMLERYIGRPALLEDALDKLVPEVYNKAIKDYEIDAIAQPNIEIEQLEPVKFKATVPVQPTVELGDYWSIRLKRDPVKVTEEQIDGALEQFRSMSAPWLPVERAVAFGDLATMDIEAKGGDEPLIAQNDVQYNVIKDSTVPVPGFAEQIEGTAKGQTKEFTILVPADYERNEQAGKEYSYKVTVKEIKSKQLPQLDDEFAKGVGEGFESLEALRQHVANSLQEKMEQEEKSGFEEKVIETVVDGAQLEYPSILIEREIRGMVDERADLLRRNRLRMDDYLNSINKTEDELRDELRPLAAKRVARALILDKVAGEEKLEVSQEEIDAEIERSAETAGDRAEEVRKVLSSPAARQSLEQILITRKTVQRLVDIATGKYKEKAAETVPKTEDESGTEHKTSERSPRKRRRNSSPK